MNLGRSFLTKKISGRATIKHKDICAINQAFWVEKTIFSRKFSTSTSCKYTTVVMVAPLKEANIFTVGDSFRDLASKHVKSSQVDTNVMGLKIAMLC